jgi:hypothetical protein
MNYTRLVLLDLTIPYHIALYLVPRHFMTSNDLQALKCLTLSANREEDKAKLHNAKVLPCSD